LIPVSGHKTTSSHRVIGRWQWRLIMNKHDSGRARDARMMNGAMMLGGRNPSGFEVDFALGLGSKHAVGPALGARMRAFLRLAIRGFHQSIPAFFKPAARLHEESRKA
jgi:hypothetical protein